MGSSPFLTDALNAQASTWSVMIDAHLAALQAAQSSQVTPPPTVSVDSISSPLVTNRPEAPKPQTRASTGDITLPKPFPIYPPRTAEALRRQPAAALHVDNTINFLDPQQAQNMLFELRSLLPADLQAKFPDASYVPVSQNIMPLKVQIELIEQAVASLMDKFVPASWRDEATMLLAWLDWEPLFERFGDRAETLWTYVVNRELLAKRKQIFTMPIITKKLLRRYYERAVRGNRIKEFEMLVLKTLFRVAAALKQIHEIRSGRMQLTDFDRSSLEQSQALLPLMQEAHRLICLAPDSFTDDIKENLRNFRRQRDRFEEGTNLLARGISPFAKDFDPLDLA